ncbi:MBL fold metallo-hydrolase [Amycolatopsis sp. GA6-003]|uniref:MBL fold metallo-hydrolase n=1 Tax=Amycolatopsis sp. GA6-003 TaxID=2652444 RepID=UPI0039171567
MCPVPGSTAAAAASVTRRSLIGGVGALAASLGVAAAGGPSTQAAAASVASPARSRLEVILLGTQAGPPVSSDRSGIATALVVDGRTYLVDCGRGATTQFVRAGLKFRSLEAIFLTHLHADHVADYYDFFLLGGSVPVYGGDNVARPVKVYGPGPAGGLPPKFGGGEAPTVSPEHPTPGTADLTRRCHDAYAYSSNVFLRDMGIADIRTLADVREIALPEVGASFRRTHPAMRPFLVLEDERVRVTATLVPHGPVFPSFAFRFDTRYGSVTFSGDTTYSDNLVTLAKGSDLLLHEAINLEGMNLSPVFRDHLLESHVEVQKVGGIAESAEAKHLVLTHLGSANGSRINPAQWRKWAQRGYGGRVTVGEDLQRIVVA